MLKDLISFLSVRKVINYMVLIVIRVTHDTRILSGGVYIGGV